MIPFQHRVREWMLACFGPEISADTAERNHRFLEEAIELVQANGCTASEAHQLVDYVFGRDVGEINQEAGGVLVTLAALLNTRGVDMDAAGYGEITRVWGKIDKIRDKQAAKPRFSPLPSFAICPLGRDELAEVLRLCDDIEGALVALPYKDATPQIANLEAIRGHVQETMPGGFAGYCEGCEKPIGWDEVKGRDEDGSVVLCVGCTPTPEEIAAREKAMAPLRAAAQLSVQGFTGAVRPMADTAPQAGPYFADHADEELQLLRQIDASSGVIFTQSKETLAVAKRLCEKALALSYGRQGEVGKSIEITASGRQFLRIPRQ